MRATYRSVFEPCRTFRSASLVALLAAVLPFTACGWDEWDDWTLGLDFGDGWSTDTDPKSQTSTDERKNPTISGDRIVWTDSRAIYVYDLAADTETKIATDAVFPQEPAISGDRIVKIPGRPPLLAAVAYGSSWVARVCRSVLKHHLHRQNSALKTCHQARNLSPRRGDRLIYAVNTPVGWIEIPTVSFFYFGPGQRAGEVIIFLGEEIENIDPDFCGSLELADRVLNPWGVPEERDVPILVCRGPRTTLQEFWEREGRPHWG